MTQVVSVKFKDKGKSYFFDPCGITVETGRQVIVETSKGQEFAFCSRGNHDVEDSCVMPPLRPVIRVATPEDIKRAEENRKRESSAFEICKERIEKHGLDMKLVDVEYAFDGSKILFFFTSDGRVDFRDLVKDLASVFRTRIELRQIGVRDEARMLGGLGICGRPFCCAGFLDDFQPVSIKMAKTQGLSLNPTKISGTCGRLMCCLKYEQDAYEDLVKGMPKQDSFVQTPEGKGAVIDVNLLRGKVKVRIDDQYDNPVKTFDASEIEILGGKAKRTEYLAAIERGEVVIQRPTPRLRREETPRAQAPDKGANAEAAVKEPDASRPEQGEHSQNRDRRQKPPRDKGGRGGEQNREASRNRDAGRGDGNRDSNREERRKKQPDPALPEAIREAPARGGTPQRYRRPQPKENAGGETPRSAPGSAEAAASAEAPKKQNYHRYRGHRSNHPKGGNGGKTES